jgi:23S rRNA (adenine2503-C2)-methyltransferase
MTNLSKKDRELLKNKYPTVLPKIVRENQSKDGTTAKLLLDFGSGILIELVIMLYERQNSRNRHTLCISTQAGCAMGCAFCATGLSGLARNLTAGEIVAQVLVGKLWLNRHDKGEVTNLVYMGMGEPLANYENVMQSLRVVNSADGLNIGQRRITVSSCGLVPQIRRFADEETEIGLAISLHAPNNELRSAIMPINKRYPLAELLEACDYYTEKTHRRISYEYALLQGVNDGREQAVELAGLLVGRLAHVNLIPVNFVAETGFLPSNAETLLKFAQILNSSGVETTVRERRGADIDGACGQLRRKAMQS